MSTGSGKAASVSKRSFCSELCSPSEFSGGSFCMRSGESSSKRSGARVRSRLQTVQVADQHLAAILADERDKKPMIDIHVRQRANRYTAIWCYRLSGKAGQAQPCSPSSAWLKGSEN